MSDLRFGFPPRLRGSAGERELVRCEVRTPSLRDEVALREREISGTLRTDRTGLAQRRRGAENCRNQESEQSLSRAESENLLAVPSSGPEVCFSLRLSGSAGERELVRCEVRIPSFRDEAALRERKTSGTLRTGRTGLAQRRRGAENCRNQESEQSLSRVKSENLLAVPSSGPEVRSSLRLRVSAREGSWDKTYDLSNLL